MPISPAQDKVDSLTCRAYVKAQEISTDAGVFLDAYGKSTHRRARARLKQRAEELVELLTQLDTAEAALNAEEA